MSDGIPQVQTGKRRDEHLNVKHMLPLPADTPFGNLSLKYTLIVERLDHVNGLIDGVFDSYQAAVAKELGSLTHHLLLAEEATYWLRKTADELLALVGVLAEREASGSYPAQAASHPIPEVLDAKSPPAWVVPHLDFLRLLNEVSNAYKHSFINSDVMMIGRDEPGVYALALKYNDLAKRRPAFYNIRVRELAERFDAFFQAALQELEGCKLPHREAAQP